MIDLGNLPYVAKCFPALGSPPYALVLYLTVCTLRVDPVLACRPYICSVLGIWYKYYYYLILEMRET